MHKEKFASLFIYVFIVKFYILDILILYIFCTHDRVTESVLVNKCLYLALRGSDCMRQQHVNAHSRKGKEEKRFGRHPPHKREKQHG